MKILFIENRYSTLLWREASVGLFDEGHNIYWIVQNKIFDHQNVNSFHIPYPIIEELSDDPLSVELNFIANTDRAIRYFGVEKKHYHYYQKAIENLIVKISPDIVFGEATQFHELMAIEFCKRKGIPYFAPNSTRYPVGRLTFFKYDTFESVGGDGGLSDEEAAQLLIQINARTVQPSYMASPQRGILTSAMRFWEQLRIARGWYEGERFITPSPWCHFKRRRLQVSAMNSWDEISNNRNAIAISTALTINEPWVLYPLQLQPESNIDVYGYPWSNQIETIERAAIELGKQGAKLLVKPNPKSKYEMSAELVDAIKRHSNIIPLPHSLPMGQLFSNAPLVLSVTGTVILESVFASKSVCVLGQHALSNLRGVTAISKPEEVGEVLQLVLKNQAIKASRLDALKLIKDLHASSYDALLWDPIARPDLYNANQIANLRKAFCQLVSYVNSSN